jgi:hypothetical protein
VCGECKSLACFVAGCKSLACFVAPPTDGRGIEQRCGHDPRPDFSTFSGTQRASSLRPYWGERTQTRSGGFSHSRRDRLGIRLKTVDR